MTNKEQEPQSVATTTAKQQKENWNKWIAALRSGEYSQGRLQLHSVDCSYETFCCVGVACKILALDSWPRDTAPEDAASIYYEVAFGKVPTTAIAPLDLHDLLGIDEQHAPFEVLYSLNDEEWWTFNQIAEYLEWVGKHNRILSNVSLEKFKMRR